MGEGMRHLACDLTIGSAVTEEDVHSTIFDQPRRWREPKPRSGYRRVGDFAGALGGIRTPNLLIRSQML